MLEKIGLPAKPSMRGATWVVDASHCQGCASQFTFINRKHHCRRCGGIFCGNCTAQRMVLRGQGDSAVRICDPCKKLEEAARYELRHGRSTRTPKGHLKAGSSEEDELLAQLLGAQKQPSQLPTSLLGTSSSSSSSKDPFVNEENEIIRTLSTDIPESVAGDVTPDELRQKAIEEKKMHRLLKSQGKPDQALQAFKRGRELERQADALEVLLRKNRKTAAGKVKNADRVDKKQDNKRDDLALELRDLGWTDTDLHADANPKTLTVEGELSQILGEIAKKPSSEGKKKGVDNSQVIAMKKRALLLKREGKLTEAKEELKKAKILEKELEERAILGESDDSEDELAELVQGLEGDGKTNDGFNLKLDSNAPVELPPMGFDIEKLLSGDLEHFGDFEVTNEDLYDPDLNSVLKSIGWDEEEGVGNLGGTHSSGTLDKEHLSEESVKDQVYTLKKEAVEQKKAGNLSEAMALLKKAKLLEKDLLEVGFKESSLEIKEKTSQRSTALNLNPAGGRPGLRNKLAVQRELLAVKKKALALRREGKIEESDRELERGKLLEKELEEADNRSKLPVNMNPVMENTSPMEIGDEMVEAEVTEADMQDPGLLSVLQDLGWDEKEDSGAAVSDNFVKQPPRKNKFQIQRELLAVKKRALALRREGKIEESQRELESAKLLERELDELNSTASESKGTRQPAITTPFQDPMKLLEEPTETQVTDTGMQNPALTSDLRNLGWDEDDSADVAPSPLLQEKAPRKEIGNFPNKPATAIQSGFGDVEAGTEAKVTETDKRDPEVSAVLKTIGLNVNEGAGAELYNIVPERKVRKSKGEMQRELLVLKRKALQLRRQGREEEAESELEKAKELEKQLAELESHCVPASEQLLMPQPSVESASSATRVTEKPVQVTQAEAPLLGIHLAEKAIHIGQINKDPHLPDQSSLKDEILMHKRKALALKREGKISEAKEELRQAKLLEKSLEESSPPTHLTATVEPEVIPESKPVQTRKSISTRDRVKIQQESLSHKRNALKLRREGKVAEAEAEFEIAKSLEAQLDDSTGEDVSSSSDVAVENFLDPQLMSALRSIGWGESDMGTVKQEPSKREVVERETRAAVERDDERLKMEGEIKREKIKALNLKRAGREKEALEVLRNAKLMEKKLASIN